MTASGGAQPSLFAPAEAGPAGSIFFALMPDPDAVAEIAGTTAALRARFGLRARAIGPARLHVTLAYLGEFTGLPPDLLDRARAAAEAVAAPAFDAVFDAVASFAGGRGARPVVLVHAAERRAITALHDNLRAALRGNGLRLTSAQPFVPHLTLLYDPAVVANASIAPIGWRVRDFALLRGHKGLREYETLGRWQLQETGHGQGHA